MGGDDIIGMKCMILVVEGVIVFAGGQGKSAKVDYLVNSQMILKWAKISSDQMNDGER